MINPVVDWGKVNSFPYHACGNVGCIVIWWMEDHQTWLPWALFRYLYLSFPKTGGLAGSDILKIIFHNVVNSKLKEPVLQTWVLMLVVKALVDYICNVGPFGNWLCPLLL